jgi:ABC-2 type transport system ATP-binding protein
MDDAIRLQNVTKRFGKQVAVDALNLAVPYGSIYGFIGPNGSGKTTTLRMILRIFQPDSGDVIVLGKPKGKSADDRLGYLPEERGLYKRMKVHEILTYYARLKGHYRCRNDIEEWLERLGAAAWSRKRIDSLSKGMAQKVQFIAAVIAKPELVILDEPFSGLDPVNMQSLKDAVLSLRQSGTTIIFSTHDMDIAEKMCDTIFMIFNGHKVLDGTLDSIQSQFPADRVRVRMDAAPGALERLRDIAELTHLGRFVEFRMEHPERAQHYLQQLMTLGDIRHFEIIKPSLHDIFVRIAGPGSDPEASTLASSGMIQEVP